MKASPASSRVRLIGWRGRGRGARRRGAYLSVLIFHCADFTVPGKAPSTRNQSAYSAGHGIAGVNSPVESQ